LAAQALSAATGNDCLPVKADVRDPRQIQAAVQQTIEKYGRIDFVINGIYNNCSFFSNVPMTTTIQAPQGIFLPQSRASPRMDSGQCSKSIQ
jgi:NAD(P)-dependent dehydrogenase (short-subunit alcohol dehydrogenase family)